MASEIMQPTVVCVCLSLGHTRSLAKMADLTEMPLLEIQNYRFM